MPLLFGLDVVDLGWWFSTVVLVVAALVTSFALGLSCRSLTRMIRPHRRISPSRDLDARSPLPSTEPETREGKEYRSTEPSLPR